MRFKCTTLCAVLLLLSACNESGLSVASIDRLKNDPSALDRFEQSNGKIGAYALPPLLLKASRFLDRPVSELEALVNADGDVATLTPLTPYQLKSESFLLLASDGTGNEPIYFETLEFENTTNERIVLILESINDQGDSQAFSYVELEPGATFAAKHNDPTRGWGGVAAGKLGRTIPEQGVKTIVKGTADGFNIATASLEAAFNPEVRCALVRNSVLKNQCIGNCSRGSCTVTSKESFWFFGEEPASCGCR